MEYLILLGVEGLKRVLENYSFTESENTEKALREYEENNNPVLIFFKEIDRGDVVNKSTRDIYTRYSMFCAENNFNPMSNVEFSKTVKRHYEVDIIDKKINGKKYRVFCEKE